MHFCFHLEQIKRCVGTDIRRIIRDHYQQLYVNKMDNLEEVDKFLEGAISQEIEPGRNRKFEQTNYQYWTWLSTGQVLSRLKLPI